MLVNPRLVTYDSPEEAIEKFYCDVCKYPLTTREDFRYSTEYECCNECYLSFAEARKDKWREGWRPKQKVIDNYIESRKKLYHNIQNRSS